MGYVSKTSSSFHTYQLALSKGRLMHKVNLQKMLSPDHLHTIGLHPSFYPILI